MRFSAHPIARTAHHLPTLVGMEQIAASLGGKAGTVAVDLGEAQVNLPFQMLMWLPARELAGELVWRQFGKYFPARVNYLDTMGGTGRRSLSGGEDLCTAIMHG